MSSPIEASAAERLSLRGVLWRFLTLPGISYVFVVIGDITAGIFTAADIADLAVLHALVSL